MQISQLQPKQMGTVRFDSDPHGADIYVDGQILTDPNTENALKTPVSVLLYEGRRNYTISIHGYTDESGYVEIWPGSTVNVYKRLKQGTSEGGWGQPEPQIWLSQQTGTLKVYSYPDNADVFIDGRPVGKAPTTISGVPAGARRVTFKMPGMMDEEKIVDIHPGAWSSIDATMRPVLPSLQPYRSIPYQSISYRSIPYQSIPYQSISYQSISYQSISYPTYEVKTMQTVKSVKSEEQLKLTAGNITVTTNPSGAKIYVDNVIKGTTPAKLTLDVGYRYIVLEKEKYFKDYNRIYVYPGLDIELSRNLSEIPYPQYAGMQKYIKSYFMSDVIKSLQGPAMGTVVITSYPAGATVEMDGKMVIDVDTKEILKTPVQMEIGMGLHDFVFRLEGYCNEFETVYIIPPTGPVYINKDFYIC
jgi:hypothetical protein